MPYTKIQYIAYNVPTLQLRASGDFQASRPLPAVDRLANTDAKARIQRIRDVAAQAAGSGLLGGADTLKIFVAPEFYFRQDRYSYREVQTVTNMFSAIMEAFQTTTFDDWLVVPGTVFWSLDAPSITNDADPPSANTKFFNTSIVVRGGFPANIELSDMEKTSTVPVVSNGTSNQKALMSPIDFAVGPTGRAARAWDGAINPNFAPIVSDWEWQKAHVFHVKGMQTGTRNITFGLEVCLEHIRTYTDPINPQLQHLTNVGALQNALDSWHGHESEEAPTIDVHIITSCGMDIDPEHVCARAGGYTLLCDGQGKQELRKVTTARNGANAAILSNPIDPTSVLAVRESPSGTSLEVPGGGTQQIKIYPAQLL